MIKNFKTKMLATMLLIGYFVDASVWTCYVQKEGTDGVYSDAVVTKTLIAPTVGPQILFSEAGFQYNVQIKENDSITLSTFNPLDSNTLILSHVVDANKTFLINSNNKTLLGCTRQ